MKEITLTLDQTILFWHEERKDVGGNIMLLDKHLYDKYTIVRRIWENNGRLVLTFEDDKYATWLLLTI